MNQGISLLIYPVKDIAKAKTLYRALLGIDPFVDGSYYVGFKAGEMEVGLDSHGKSSGLIARVKDADGNTVGLRQA